MMMKATKVTMTTVALLFMAAIATSAFGFGWGRGPGCDGGQCGGDFKGLAGVELTADQKAQLQSMREAQYKEIAPLGKQMFAKRDEVKRLWLEVNPDQAKINAAQAEMRSLRDQLQDKMTALRLDELNVLTSEQREKLKSTLAGRGFRAGRGFGPGGCDGGGCASGGPGPAGCGGGGCSGGGPGAGVMGNQ
jgi:Spy/CpxP family protein refolding chaperone